MKKIIFMLLAVCTYTANAQNAVKNADLNSGWSFWDNNGCTPQIGGIYGWTGTAYWAENVYGGPTTTNLVAHLGAGCMNQNVCLVKGLTYNFSFKGQRRCEADNPDLPAVLSLRAIVRGMPSFTEYSNVVYNYTNTTWNWTTQSVNFTVPLNTTDNQFFVIFVSENQILEFGALVDDVAVTPVPGVTINGPGVAQVNSATSWSVNNLPASGVTYSWSFPGATPSVSTEPSPTNIVWPSTGSKAVNCVINNNGVCDVFTLNQSVNITTALPVTISSFNAARKPAAIGLTWITSTELNSDHFILYRSKNGINFTEIATVKATGNATGSTYTYTDPQAVPELVYYRLKQVDKNNASKLSGIVKVNVAVKDLDVSVYPTLVTTSLNYTLETPKAIKAVLKITDMSGRRILHQAQAYENGFNKKAIDVSNLASGVYLLTIEDNVTGLKKTIPFNKN